MENEVEVVTRPLADEIGIEAKKKVAENDPSSDYDNLESDDEPEYETISLLDHDVRDTPQIIKRPVSVNFRPCHRDTFSILHQVERRPYTRDYTPVPSDATTTSDTTSTTSGAATSDATGSRDDVTPDLIRGTLEPHAIVVQVTGGENEENRSWTRLSEKSQSKRNSRASDAGEPLSPDSAVRALGGERARNPSGRSHQILEPPFRYKQWLMHLGRRRRCEILILLGLLLWLAFFFILAVVLNGSKHTTEPETTPGDGQTMSSGKLVTPATPTRLTDLLDAAPKTKELNVTPGSRINPLTLKPDVKTTPHTHTAYPIHTIALVSEQHTSTPKIATDPETLLPARKDTTPESKKTSSPLGGVIKPEIQRIGGTEATRSATTRPPVLAAERKVKGEETPYRTGIKESTQTTSAPNVHELLTTVHQDEPKVTAQQHSQKPKIVTKLEDGSDKDTHADSLHTYRANTKPTNDNVVIPDVKPVLSEFLDASFKYEDIAGLRNISEILKEKPNYMIGVGRADITGPAADVNMMGYANPSQTSGGIHIRQYSRAFIIEDPDTKSRIAFVNIDACMASTLLKLEVLKALSTKFGDLYTAENLCISGTHTHSAPAGYLQDVLFQISSWGYVEETLDVMVKGVVESILLAHEAVRPGYILLNKGELLDSNINRSPLAYLNNPHSERARYPYDVDKDMTLLRFVDEEGNGVGMINWFPVHCTSMNNTNKLISGDNKGYAELLFEGYMDPGSLPGESKFVAAFAQSNEGDVSPNTRGPHCLDTGEPCDNIHSTCNGKVQNCVSSGPGKDMFESTKIIGMNQYKKAKELYESASVSVRGPIRAVQQFVNMTSVEVVVNETSKVKTCKPAMGFSFAAGTTDGPGAFDFTQGDKSGNTFWQLVRNFLHAPSDEQISCHSPKPILLDTGEMTSPYQWQPSIVDTQVMQIGPFAIIAVPGEFTTMAGRRLRDAVIESLHESDPKIDWEAVVAGLANTYSDYIATFEEYQVQRYEGASTIYGPHTALAYVQQYKKLTKMMSDGEKPSKKVRPRNDKKELYSFLPGVIYDRSGFWAGFGDVIDDAEQTYSAGEEVRVKFIGANPRNVLQTSQPNVTFIKVERQLPDASWELIHTDASWETKFIWKRTSQLQGTSEVTVVWNTDKSTKPGLYKIIHQGFYKYYLGGIYQYEGHSRNFRIENTA